MGDDIHQALLWQALQDNAPDGGFWNWHISHDLKIPVGLHLTLLPSHSPELQPAERLWTLVDEPIANQSFKTLDDLEEVFISEMPISATNERFYSRVNWFHWWIKIGV
ncbi:Transposase [Nostoc flagelliforme CCNUN1]|uniref:Transposase n=1 Tax=Nostoc flagelliforme CCNUN1 TaxID=2038116 RepID=A0A2K8T3U2_9NOSO|nr:Transposase [Nostoc flagelliforme CCNUN1]